ncbi:DUF3343 domain-containing protein [Phascolarctobacterium sp.]|uniref:DUF3343 domain-containing protein n=1 Tax=Phascolarctobacterium sp. TaxID=2049039 RepID=UPI0038687845
MRQKRKYIVLTFATTEAALAVESACAEQGLAGRLIPTPQAISSGCGLAWRVPVEEADPLLAQLARFTIERVAEVEM